MKKSSTAYLSERSIIKCIKTDNNKKIMLRFQAEKKYGWEQCGIKIAGIKNAKTSSRSEVVETREANTSINLTK